MSVAVVLVHPEIPHNTGAVGRTCVALDLELILIRPYGFEISSKHLKRAGLDYWQHVRLTEYDCWDAFLAARAPREEQMFLYEEYGAMRFDEPAYPDDAYLVFGCETKGLPTAIVEPLAHRIVSLPMRSPHIRSLNLSNTVAVAAYQALRGKF
ncbi:tRNA (cytidine(34)-2'-O)-methyltransferase [Caenibius tardaugens NBRC 16725]|uniref:tRNA (cytidine(34)-2'-O)-methyltransferase n=1 Tax=Caenibius tardaugens NBRC 16725 TaxID=1219035 RepID=U2Y881_9SPHN|nr:tRNA (cytidine(34)-2'-O)-methyltransferase [Caenibius tardaugens]AZI36749.1 tRNA (cytidine(34)-2'-O)-methyltransferase [Caenibius tardaugens NBRC 16725]GAD49421.1 tRNA (cytidine(34)-2'-O)-methyltransferase [Caenibius tardaugens NBRC 16725]